MNTTNRKSNGHKELFVNGEPIEGLNDYILRSDNGYTELVIVMSLNALRCNLIATPNKLQLYLSTEESKTGKE